MVTLDIISDPICPWCWIGKTKLDAALAQASDHPFAMHWRPFQLNPDMPREGMDRQSYLSAKFGGRERAKEIYGRVEAAAEAAGLDVDFSRMTRTPNTLDAHRLIRWARQHNGGQADGGAAAQTAVVSRMFELYFRDGADLGDREVLQEVGETAGLEREVTAALLASDADLEEIRAEDVSAREMGVTGVPTFLIGGKYVVQGAQDAETWSRVVAELQAAA
ncbi:MAG: DsbA family oxidoreductase [Pseudomonadota bacterium]